MTTSDQKRRTPAVGDFIVQHLHVVLNLGDPDIVLLRRVAMLGIATDYESISEGWSGQEARFEAKARSLAHEAYSAAWRLEHGVYTYLGEFDGLVH